MEFFGLHGGCAGGTEPRSITTFDQWLVHRFDRQAFIDKDFKPIKSPSLKSKSIYIAGPSCFSEVGQFPSWPASTFKPPFIPLVFLRKSLRFTDFILILSITHVCMGQFPRANCKPIRKQKWAAMLINLNCLVVLTTLAYVILHHHHHPVWIEQWQYLAALACWIMWQT